MIKKTLLGASLSLILLTAYVSTQAKTDAAADNTATADTITMLKEKLKKIFKSEPASIKPSAVPDLYEVMYGTEVVYVTADGKYFLAGDLINMDSRKNMTEVAKRSVVKDLLNKKDNKPVVFKADNEKYKLTVFTDIDCPYCAKLHREVPELNKKGVTIEYLMFPRAGLASNSFNKAVSMWCADDQQQAMTDAKARRPIPEKTCDNPIADQYNLGGEIGVNGTPALITQSGKMIPGYVPADRLVRMLEADAKTSKN